MAINLRNLSEFNQAIQKYDKLVIHFWAGWCDPCAHLDQILNQLAKEAPTVTCARVEAEETPDVSALCQVAVVPLFAFFSNGTEIDRLEGADPAALTSKFFALRKESATGSVQTARTRTPQNGEHLADAPFATPKDGIQLQQRLDALVRQKPIMLFMKGSPDAPRCGFSSQVVAALRSAGAEFGSFDILSDDAVRQGLKEYSQWPTFPQVYVNGELLGGCDIVLEMASNGELTAELKKAGPAASTTHDLKAALEARLHGLVRQSPVMVFMKGTPQEPRCGFSAKVVNSLQAIDVQFGSFDILSDDAVRQGLKEYSQWPTFPQVYVNGELLGGCDIVLEMASNGELKRTIEDGLRRNA